jgi:dipeptidyl-peptidase 4
LKRRVVVSISFTVLSASFLITSFSSAQQSSSNPQSQQTKELTLAAIFAEGGLTGRAPETIRWSPDGKRVSYVLRDNAGERGELYHVDLESGRRAVLVASEKLSVLVPPADQIKDEREKERRTRYSVAGYHWAPDSKHLLFDSKGQLWLYSLDTGTAVQVTSATDPSGDPKFSPDGTRIAYVRKHNLYMRPVNGKEGETQLTEGLRGKQRIHIEMDLSDKLPSEPGPDDILNGEVDWVYAEEFGVRSNYFWSPDGKQIAYLQMDETKVPSYPIEDFIPTHATVDNQKYPKAGDPNPMVRVGVVGSDGGKTRWISVSGDKRDKDKDEDPDIYIPRFGWVRSGLLYIEVLNRAQDKLDLYLVDASSGRSRLVLTESSSLWVDVNDNFKVLKSGDRFLWSSWRDGHTHLCLYGFNKADPLAPATIQERQLTRGDYETFGIQGVDENSGTVYFLSAQGDPRQRQLYSVKLSGGDPQRVSREPGTHDASFPDVAGEYYVDNYSGLMTPPRLSLCKVGGTCVSFWQSRDVAQYDLSTPQWLELKGEDGTPLYGMLMLPAGGAFPAGAKIPLLVYIYGGPAGQTVRNAWGGSTFLFHQILTRRGFAVFTVDNRGTPGRGQKFMAPLRHQFGEIELRDQLAALEQLFAQFPQLDRDRIGMWGWSNGGSMTLYAMTHSPLFKAGVAVAPVTDLKDYDTIYMERYMGLPQDNPDGYKRGSMVNSAKDLRGRVLMVHGTSDDNVHMQNTIQMTNALINEGKQFDLMLYPRKTHGIAGAAARTNLFTRIQWQLEHYLMKPEPATATQNPAQ